VIDIHKNIYIYLNIATGHSDQEYGSPIRCKVWVCVSSAEDTGQTETSYLPENKSFFCVCVKHTEQKHFFYKNKINIEFALQGDWMRQTQSCLSRKACIKGLEVGIVKTTQWKIHYKDRIPIILILNPRAGYTVLDVRGS